MLVREYLLWEVCCLRSMVVQQALRLNYLNNNLMKVKCIKTALDNIDNQIINGQMKGYLSINDEFWVYGISFYRQRPYIYIFNGDHLIKVPLELFEIIDGTVPAGWKIKNEDNGAGVTLYPELFYREDFIENFGERESVERNLFKAVQVEIEHRVERDICWFDNESDRLIGEYRIDNLISLDELRRIFKVGTDDLEMRKTYKIDEEDSYQLNRFFDFDFDFVSYRYQLHCIKERV
jgi:hypothetical protein